jgi:ribosomal protein L11
MTSDAIFKFRLFIPAGKATIMPPLGSILTQYGINAVQFCNDFNSLTKIFMQFSKPEFDLISKIEGEDFIQLEDSIFMLVVDIFLFSDKTYKFIINKPSLVFLLRLFLKIKSCKPQSVIAFLSLDILILLAMFKFPQLPLYNSCQIIRGITRSLGIKIII